MAKARQAVRLYPELQEKLRNMSKETDIPMNRIIERALEDYIQKYEKKKGGVNIAK